ncbi:hypothetical protein BY996DRAFT_6436511 [Phakopsora pachyrhizi]|nr:hypothetical protein BY996DRAFT_6436511 [Phakopsora pachyrhizi]
MTRIPILYPHPQVLPNIYWLWRTVLQAIVPLSYHTARKFSITLVDVWLSAGHRNTGALLATVSGFNTNSKVLGLREKGKKKVNDKKIYS